MKRLFASVANILLALLVVLSCDLNNTPTPEAPVKEPVVPPAPQFNPLTLTLTQPQLSPSGAVYLSTNQRGQLDFAFRLGGTPRAGQTNAFSFLLSSADGFKSEFTTNLSVGAFTNNGWRFTNRVNLTTAEGAYQWRMVASNFGETTAAVRAAAREKAGEFGYQWPVQAVGGVVLTTIKESPPGNVRLSWNAPLEGGQLGLGYRVYGSAVSAAAQSPLTPVVRQAGGSAYVDLTATEESAYYYSIVSTNAVSAATNTGSGKVGVFGRASVALVTPADGKILTADSSGGTVAFTWNSSGSSRSGAFSTNYFYFSSQPITNWSRGKALYTNAVSTVGALTNLLPAALFTAERSFYWGVLVENDTNQPAARASRRLDYRFAPAEPLSPSAEVLDLASVSNQPVRVQVSFRENPAGGQLGREYEVLWDSVNPPKARVATGVKGTSVVLPAAVAKAGLRYYYRVVAKNQTGLAAESAVGLLSIPLTVNYKVQSAAVVDFEPGFYGAASPDVKVRWTLTGTPEAGVEQEVRWGDSSNQASTTRVANLDLTKREFTIPTAQIGILKGTKPFYLQLVGRKSGKEASHSPLYEVRLHSCGAKTADGYELVCSRTTLEAINDRIYRRPGAPSGNILGKFRLENDLDLGGKTYTKAIIGRPPADEYSYIFYGEVDGNGHRIYNGIIDADNKNIAGFIARVSSLYVYVTGEGWGGDDRFTNGQPHRPVIKNLGVQLKVINAAAEAGILIGTGSRGATVSNVYTAGSISSGKNLAEVGGIVGGGPGVSLFNSYSTAKVTSSSTSDFPSVGGLVGRVAFSATVARGSSISNVYARGKVTRKVGNGTDFGSVVGSFFMKEFSTNLYYDATQQIDWNGDLSGDGTPPSDWAEPGAASRRVRGIDISTVTAANYRDRFQGFDFDRIWDWDASRNGGWPFLRAVPPEMPPFKE